MKKTFLFVRKKEVGDTNKEEQFQKKNTSGLFKRKM
jgi:hypothetical protein